MCYKKYCKFFAFMNVNKKIEFLLLTNNCLYLLWKLPRMKKN